MIFFLFKIVHIKSVFTGMYTEVYKEIVVFTIVFLFAKSKGLCMFVRVIFSGNVITGIAATTAYKLYKY